MTVTTVLYIYCTVLPCHVCGGNIPRSNWLARARLSTARPETGGAMTSQGRSVCWYMGPVHAVQPVLTACTEVEVGCQPDGRSEGGGKMGWWEYHGGGIGLQPRLLGPLACNFFTGTGIRTDGSMGLPAFHTVHSRTVVPPSTTNHHCPPSISPDCIHSSIAPSSGLYYCTLRPY